MRCNPQRHHLEIAMSDKNQFPGYPHLKKVAYSERYGRMELVEVSETSDGYLIGYALFGTGNNRAGVSVFLGRKPS